MPFCLNDGSLTKGYLLMVHPHQNAHMREQSATSNNATNSEPQGQSTGASPMLVYFAMYCSRRYPTSIIMLSADKIDVPRHIPHPPDLAVWGKCTPADPLMVVPLACCIRLPAPYFTWSELGISGLGLPKASRS